MAEQSLSPTDQPSEDSNDSIQILEESSEILPHSSQKSYPEPPVYMSNEAHTSNTTTDKIKFGCDICNAAFTCVYHFYRHLKLIHGKDPFKYPIKCTICGAICSTGQNFIDHRETVHNSKSQREQKFESAAKRGSKLTVSNESSVPVIVLDDDDGEGVNATYPRVLEPVSTPIDINGREGQVTSKQPAGPPRSNGIKTKRNIPSRRANIGCIALNCNLKFKTFADLQQHKIAEHKEEGENVGLNRCAKKGMKSNITTPSSKRVRDQSRCKRQSKKGSKENVKSKVSSGIRIGVQGNDSTKTDEFSRYNLRGTILSSENIFPKQHTKYWDFPCKICKKTFFDKDQLNEHMRITHQTLVE